MSELAKRNIPFGGTRGRYFLTVSLASLVGAISASGVQAESDTDRPTVWIELGGQLERVGSSQEVFAPDFSAPFTSNGVLPLAQVQRQPRYDVGLEGELEFQPSGSDWKLDVSLRYGRSSISKSSHYQTSSPPVLTGTVSIPLFGFHQHIVATPIAKRFADSASRTDESHAVLDFQAGRDVGMGLFGARSTIDFGVRFAQFTSHSSTQITANPGGSIPFKYGTTFRGLPAYVNGPYQSGETWDIYRAVNSASRSFSGLGPSLAIRESLSLAGGLDTMQAKFDFGLNGSILFGRQKAKVHYNVSDERPITPHRNIIYMTSVYHHNYDRIRSRSLVVPNIGAFAGLSFDYANAAISLGYRADFFFGAMDGGIDSRRSYDRNFHGPFATVSIGLGG